MVVSAAVLYNFLFVIGRAVFWELNNAAPALWWTLDYTCDIIYLLDTLIHAHEGEINIKRQCLIFACLQYSRSIRMKLGERGGQY